MDLPADWLALLVMVFGLGARHGLDADHLATIDGLTRYSLRHAPRRARWCGSLFSLGHGAVVTGIALAVGMASRRWQVPPWVGEFGAWVAIGIPLLLGWLNLRAVFAAPADALVAPAGLKAGLLRRLHSTTHPLAIAALGALFAVSFDTLSQATLFAVTAARHGGAGHALALGLAFAAGMLLADGINGLWVARLLRRADRRARLASRVMGLAVAAVSFAVAGLGIARHFGSGLAAWYEGRELAVGVAVMAVVGLGYLAGGALARRVQGGQVARG